MSMPQRIAIEPLSGVNGAWRTSRRLVSVGGV